MGFWSDLFGGDARLGSGTIGSGGPADGAGIGYRWYEPNVTELSGQEWAETVAAIAAQVLAMTPSQLWRTQPSLRTVVSFVARNVAQLGLHTFERVSESDRVRDRSNPFAVALGNPGDRMTSYRLIFALVGDKMLYDRAYWMPWTDRQGNPRIRRVPAAWVSVNEREDAYTVKTYKVWTGTGTKSLIVPAEKLIEFGGYHPTSPSGCSPTLETLKETLAEQIESTKYRAQTWKRGGRVSSVIQRPLDAPPWTDGQATRFREDWYANYTGDGPHAGGTPILEDGMTINRIDFSALDMQWVEGSKLSQIVVASAFFVNPTMIGILDNANYSNVREFRRMLYGDTLGPTLREIEDDINTFVLPLMRVRPEVYAEFNIQEKLQGSFEEQAAVMQSATGAPWMLRSEARSRMNLPEIDGADELVVPLNVLIGGQASPQDSGSQNVTGTGQPEEAGGPKPAAKLRVKARVDAPVEEKVAQSVWAFFKRQEASVRSKLGTKDGEDWWEGERWDKELSHDLMALATLVTSQVATKTLDAIGFDPSTYDSDRTLAWLSEVSERSASSLNAATKARLDEALAGDEPAAGIDSVFTSQEARAAVVAASTVTLLSGFATVEATKQAVGDEKATKTWRTGANPRQAHKVLDGETVLLSENFSNGAAWPGDGQNLGADDLSNCNCELEINVL